MSKLLILLCFLSPSASFSMTCRSLLQNTDYNTYEIATLEVRSPEEIDNNDNGRLLMSQLSGVGDIIPNVNSPYTRTQCFGTCYLYSSITLIENELLLSGLIKSGDMLLAPSVLIETAQTRLADEETPDSVEKLIHGGWLDAFHSIQGNGFYYYPREEIKKLGDLRSSSEVVLELEHSFLTVTLSQVDEGFNFGGYSLERPDMSQLFTELLSDYIHEHASEDNDPLLEARSIGPLAFNYTYHWLFEVEFDDSDDGVKYYKMSKTIDSDEFTGVSEVQDEITILEYENGDLIQEVENYSFEDEDIRRIVQKILENKFVLISLDQKLFGEAHAVVLTNIVVDHDSKSIVGFVYLDSNSEEQGLLGYNFINVEELRQYMYMFTYVNQVRTSSNN